MEGLIYAYHAPKSDVQQAWTERRRAELAAERGERKSSLSSVETTERSPSSCSGSAVSIGSETRSSGRLRHSSKSRDGGGRSGTKSRLLSAPSKMETLVARTTTLSLSSSESSLLLNSPRIGMTMEEKKDQRMLSNPFELRHGRRYLKNVPYPLPCDLAEIQRQNMRTLLAITVFGAPICSPRWQRDTPKRVLELGCGGAYWTSMAHDYFAERGVKNVEFVGLDIAPLAPDLRKQGINWRFVQHDVRRVPLPFDDGEFDLVMVKDLSLAAAFDRHSQLLFEEFVRIVANDGTLEIWESDHVLRSLPPDTPPPPSTNTMFQRDADATATFAIAPGQEFLPPQNKHLVRAGKWMTEALNRRGLHPTPCVRIADMLTQEPGLMKLEQRRVAIPFGKLRWERKAEAGYGPNSSNGHDSPMSAHSWRDKTLTADQLALRQTALTTMLQLIESMEPMLRETSGKNSEEWGQWWASMMSELLDPSGAALQGECLELGATWATKRPPYFGS